MTSSLPRTPKSVAAAGALAAVLFATAAAQEPQHLNDPRLARLDTAARSLVAVAIDSARAAGLPTEPLVQRALEGATKDAPGTLIVSAVQRLAADLGRAPRPTVAPRGCDGVETGLGRVGGRMVPPHGAHTSRPDDRHPRRRYLHGALRRVPPVRRGIGDARRTLGTTQRYADRARHVPAFRERPP